MPTKVKLTPDQLQVIAAIALQNEAASVVVSGNPTSVLYQLHYEDGTFGSWAGPLDGEGRK